MKNFIPVPIVGQTYFTSDSRTFLVTNIESEETEEIVTVSYGEYTMKYNQLQWNEIGAKIMEPSNTEQEIYNSIILHEENQKTLSEIQAKRETGKTLKGKCGFINELLWSCAGVDKDLLRACTTDWAKKAGMGGTILSTAVLTGLSGGYAAYIVSGNIWWAVIVGLIWSIVVLNLDRYLVNSMYSDGKSTISSKEYLSSLPRQIIAIFIGLTIAIPMELQVFRPAIEKQLMENAYMEFENAELKMLKEELVRQENIVENKYNDWKQKYQLFEDDLHGAHGSYGFGPRTIHLEENANFARKEYIQSENVRDSLWQRYNTIVSAQQKHIENYRYSLTERLKAFAQVTAFQNGKNKLYWFSLLIILFSMTLEILPILSKMMEENGKYEKLLLLEATALELNINFQKEQKDILQRLAAKYGHEQNKEK